MCEHIEASACTMWPQSCTPSSSKLGFGDGGRPSSPLWVMCGTGCSIYGYLRMRGVIDQHLVRRRPLHTCFIDIMKACDSVDEETLWKALFHRGAPPILCTYFKTCRQAHAVSVGGPGVTLGQVLLSGWASGRGCYLTFAGQFIHRLCDQGCNAHHQLFGYHFSIHRLWACTS
jgi:hypothetical protein